MRPFTPASRFSAFGLFATFFITLTPFLSSSLCAAKPTQPQSHAKRAQSSPTASTKNVAELPVALQVGQAMPALRLPVASSSRRAMWDAGILRGQSALLLLVIGRQGPQSRGALPLPVLRALTQSAQQLRFRGVEVAIVSGNAVPEKGRAEAAQTSAKADTILQSESEPPPILLDARGQVTAMLNLIPSAVVLAAFDRAGFLRQVRVLDPRLVTGASATDTEQLAVMLRQIGDPTPPLQEGQPAPDFSVRDMDGKMQRLADYRGNNLLVTFFPRCFTPNCTSQLVSLQRHAADLAAADVRVLGVSIDPAEGAKGQRAFARELGLGFPLVPDTGRNFSILYGAAQGTDQLASRMSVLIDKDGVVRWIDKQIDVKTHGADVLRKLQEPQSSP